MKMRKTSLELLYEKIGINLYLFLFIVSRILDSISTEILLTREEFHEHYENVIFYGKSLVRIPCLCTCYVHLYHIIYFFIQKKYNYTKISDALSNDYSTHLDIFYYVMDCSDKQYITNHRNNTSAQHTISHIFHSSSNNNYNYLRDIFNRRDNYKHKKKTELIFKL
jgi:hypothetical protein